MEFYKEEFVGFIDVLTSISKYCTDCQIKQGQIRIRTDNKAAFYDIKHTCLKDLDLSIVSIKNFVDLLKLFVPQEENDFVTIETENQLKIFDRFTNISIEKCNEEVLQNKYLTDQELDQIKFNERKLLFKSTLDNVVIERIKSISKIFAVSTLSLMINDDVKLILKSESKTKVADFHINIHKNDLNFTGELVFPFIVLDYPFVGEVQLQIYRLPQALLIESYQESPEVHIFSGVIKN